MDEEQEPRKENPIENPDMLDAKENIDQRQSIEISKAEARESQVIESENEQRRLLANDFQLDIVSISNVLTPHNIVLFIILSLTFVLSIYFLSVF